MSEYSIERADILEAFVEYRIAANRWSSVPAKNLLYFDRYCSREFPGISGLDQHMVDGWCKQRETENKRSRIDRCYPVIQLVKYLNAGIVHCGFQRCRKSQRQTMFLMRSVKLNCPRFSMNATSGYKPHLIRRRPFGRS